MSTSAKIILLLNILFLTVSCELQKTPLTSERVIVMAHSVGECSQDSKCLANSESSILKGGNKKSSKKQKPESKKPLNVENPDELKDEEDEGKPKFAPAEKTDKKVKASPKMFASRRARAGFPSNYYLRKGTHGLASPEMFASKGKGASKKSKPSNGGKKGQKSGKKPEMFASKAKGVSKKSKASKEDKIAKKGKSGKKPEMFASKGKGCRSKKSKCKGESSKGDDRKKPEMFASKAKGVSKKSKASKGGKKGQKSAFKGDKSGTTGKKSGNNASSEMLASKKGWTKSKKSGSKTKGKKSGKNASSEMLASEGQKSLEKPESMKWKDSIDEGESKTARKDEPMESKKPTRMFQD